MRSVKVGVLEDDDGVARAGGVAGGGEAAFVETVVSSAGESWRPLTAP